MRNFKKGSPIINCFIAAGLIMAVFLFLGCSASKTVVRPSKKYHLSKIQKDYTIFRNMLEAYHPGLYWYTTKDTLDYLFQQGYQQLKDSMTESEFRKVLSFIISGIHCGHTAVRPSKGFAGEYDSARTKVFPLTLKVWDDTAVIIANLIRKDSVLKRGTVISKINGRPIQSLIDTFSRYISSDGYNKTHKWQTLSNRGYFGSIYTSLFGLSVKYNIEYIDSAGQARSVMLPVYNPATDTAGRSASFRPVPFMPGLTKKERKKLQLSNTRSLRFDTANHIAFMTLNTFSRGSQIKKFIRTSFKKLRKNNSGYFVIDVRGNGGGNVTNSTKLSRYLATQHFRVADSLYAIKKRSRYGRYIQNNFFNRLFITFTSKKKNDGHYHFGYFERHYFKPKKKNHFDGHTYIVTGGNSFSATTLFISAIKEQGNVTIVGEETGGGAYGNTAWLIPDVTLPETKVRFRLPLFRLVIDKNNPKTGRGIFPTVEVAPTVASIMRGKDIKMEKVMELIEQEKSKKNK